MAKKLNATAVFDGVGGALLSNILDTLPYGSTVYCYGFLDKENPVTFNSMMLMNGITLKSFTNALTPTVQDAGKLQEALLDISSMIGMPHFRTKIGKTFALDEVNEALSFSSSQGKAMLTMP